jgi:sensor domain CHASE-containing protein
LSIGQRRLQTRRDNQAAEIDQLFEDWASWHDRTRRMVSDPNPYVEVKAVFQG